MKQQFLSGHDDCEWLANKINKQAPGAGAQFRSAILYGNEDCPIACDLYRDADPMLSDSFVRIAFEIFPLE